MTPAFLPNPTFADDFAAESDTREGLRDLAQGVVPLATANVSSARGPWIPNKDKRDPVEVVETEAGVFVTLTDHAGHIMELGGQYSGPLAPLRRACAAAGMRITGGKV